MYTLYRYVDNYDLLSLLLKLCGQNVLFCPSSPPFFLLLLHKYVHTHTHTHTQSDQGLCPLHQHDCDCWLHPDADSLHPPRR